MLINNLIVIGFGLIGASVAAGLKQRGACRKVTALARSETTRKLAVELGFANQAFRDLSELPEAPGSDDLICIAVPTLTMATVIKDLKTLKADEVTVTDCASVKSSVLASLKEVFGSVPANFVPGHPIAGSEKSGVSAANPALYENHRVILTPTTETDSRHVDRVKTMWELLGAEVLTMPVDEHDDVLAATSHLPHVIAYSLVDTLAHDAENENIFRYAAGGFRDFTRIASSDPTMWRDIMLANRSSILKALDLFSNNLDQLRSAIENEDAASLMNTFTRAKSARDHFVSLTGITKAGSTKERNWASREMNQKNSQYIVQAGGVVEGALKVPGDKSISHRSIMLGSIAEGITEVEGFLEGEDALATLQSFRSMGVQIEGPDQGRLKIHGLGLHGLQKPSGPLYLGNSGTSMRLLAGLLSGQSFDSVLTGDESLSKRPMKRVAEPLAAMGAEIETAKNGTPPVKIIGGKKLRGIDYSMPMASGQVKSCVLLAGLYADGETKVTEPAVTRDHTERMLRSFGYDVISNGAVASLQGGGKLTATTLLVPGDISSAAFFLVAASITPGSDLTLTNVGINPTRTGVISILKLMGADISMANKRKAGDEPIADIRVKYAPLKGIEIPEQQVPLAIDEFPALFIAAACADGKTILTGAEELRVKESDRIQVMADGLKILGVDAKPTRDGMVIEGGEIGGGQVESHGDHRIAMAFTVAALRAKSAITINDCANVATSFPGFVELARSVGISLEEKTS
ncbi:bifunctional prephenate dehydrogenase/3-phosphoshikimate 1-carboxyvinyltransferase [Aurantivibrio infirmus]